MQRVVVVGCSGAGKSTFSRRLGALLDLPRWRCLLRVGWRTLRGWGRDGQAAGCPERWDPEFVRWVWRWPRDRRARMLARITAEGGHTCRIVLGSPRQVTGFFDAISTKPGEQIRRPAR